MVREEFKKRRGFPLLGLGVFLLVLLIFLIFFVWGELFYDSGYREGKRVGFQVTNTVFVTNSVLSYSTNYVEVRQESVRVVPRSVVVTNSVILQKVKVLTNTIILTDTGLQ